MDVKEDKPTVLLSQNAPTHHFFHVTELQKLVNLINSILGPDVDNLGKFSSVEFGDDNWNGRQWKLDSMTLKLAKDESFIQMLERLG